MRSGFLSALGGVFDQRPASFHDGKVGKCPRVGSFTAVRVRSVLGALLLGPLTFLYHPERCEMLPDSPICGVAEDQVHRPFRKEVWDTRNLDQTIKLQILEQWRNGRDLNPR